MKHILFFFLIITSSSIVFAKKTKEVKSMDEVYRNQFHFSTELNRLGSPVSITQIDTTYYLYFQHNSENFIDGFYNWSYAKSYDLINWDFQKSILTQPSSEADSMDLTPWWGTVVKNDKVLKGWVNRWSDGIYQIESKDGVTWSEEKKTIGLEALKKSEPYVFWHKKTNHWIMFAFERTTTTMYVLKSADGLVWNETTSFNYNFGFPQIIELPVDRKADETRWVMFTEKGTYMIGGFDGEKFKIESSLIKHNHSRQVGSSIVYKDKNKERTILISNVNGKQKADLGSNGFFTFPTEVSLHEHVRGIELYQKPIDAISTLYTKSMYWDEKKIYPGIKNNILKKAKGSQFHIKGTIDLLNCDQFGFILRSDKYKNGTEIVYSVKDKLFTINNAQFECEPVNNKIEFEMLIDRSSVEFYVNGGRYAYSFSFSPIPESLFNELYSKGGEIMVDHLEAHELKSIWNEE